MIVSVVGNIGCGKSTVLRHLDALPRCRTFSEPLDRWKTWLDAFYAQPEQFAFGLQMKILLEHTAHALRSTTTDHSCEVTIAERSPEDALHVFARVLTEGFCMTELEYELLREYTERFGWVPDVCVYLRLDPETCLARVRARSRTCEKQVDLDYLRKIHDKYETWVEDVRRRGRVRVYVVDASRSESEVLRAVRDAIECV